MWKRIRRIFGGSRVSVGAEIDHDEIFLDDSNLPAFDRHQFEGRLERPITRRVIFSVGAFFALISLVFLGRSFALQVENGALYAARSKENRLRQAIVFGERGVVYDRKGTLLASNAADPSEPAFSRRVYAPIDGVSHTVGYLKYPKKDSAG